MEKQNSKEGQGPPEYVDVSEAASIAGLSKRSVYSRCASGAWASYLQSVQSGRGVTMKRFIMRSDIEAESSPEMELQSLSAIGKKEGGALQLVEAIEKLNEVAGGLAGFQDTAARLAEAIEKQNELQERQSRRKLWGIVITSAVSLSILGAALWYCVQVLQSAGIYF